MHSVTTSKKICCVSAVLHVLETYYTVLVQTLIDALVIVLQEFTHTTSAVITVKEILRRSDSADATLVTMEHTFFLPLVIIKRANVAEVGGEVFMTLGAGATFLLLVSTS